MTSAIYYPKANREIQWYGAGNAIIAPNKQLWHTTEGTGWPDYAGGTMAPNLTYHPWIHTWRQHFQLNGSARALANGTDGWQTNRKAVCQVEIIGYCDPAKFGTGKGIDSLDQQAYDDLGAFSEFMHAEWGVPMTMTVAAKPYPASWGANGVRLSRDAFVAYRGHLEHQHAPNNNHGDAGALDVHRFLAMGDADMPLNDADKAWILGAIRSEGANGGGDPHHNGAETTWAKIAELKAILEAARPTE